MLERISEPISNFFSINVNSSTNIDIIDFETETNNYKSIISGGGYNFNYSIDYLSASYLLPSLIEKPEREYRGITQAQRTAEDVKYSKTYNETTFDAGSNKYHAIKLILSLSNNSLTVPLGEVLLYNSLIRVSLPLMPYIGSPVMNDSCILKARAINVDSSDSIIISGSYSGSVNYSFDTGSQSHSFI